MQEQEQLIQQRENDLRAAAAAHTATQQTLVAVRDELATARADTQTVCGVGSVLQCAGVVCLLVVFAFVSRISRCFCRSSLLSYLFVCFFGSVVCLR